MAKGVVRTDIERLVTWALRDQGLGWSGADSFSALQQVALLGTMVDTSPSSSHPTIGLWSSDDALRVKEAIDGLPVEARALVWRYGRAGLRPEWGAEGEGSWQQETDAAGRLRWDWDDPVNRTGGRRPHLVYVGTDPEVIEAERAEYALWREALVSLVDPLNRVLTEYVATGPAAPSEPWLQPKPVVHGAGEAGAVAPRPLVRERLAAELRADAQDLVQAQATDWSTENSVLHRRDSRRRGRPSGGG